MQQKNETGKNKSKLGPIIIGVLVVLFAMMDDMPDEVFGAIALLVLLAIPVGVLAVVIRTVRKRGAGAQGHSHDRIDHTGDLKINPRTGKTESHPVRTAVAHSPKEHWKQQLDGLLANGTIDRAEYRALMKRRF